MDKTHFLLLVDDHQFVRMALRLLLSSLPGVVTVDEACSLEEGLRAAGEGRHDLVLLDLDLPDSSGLDTLHTFLRHCPHAAVALVSGDSSLTTMAAAMAEDVRGYVVKSQPPEIITAAVGLMLAGGRYIPPDLYASVAARTAAAATRPEAAAACLGRSDELERLREQLTPRLREVLDLVVHGKSNKEISSQLGLSLGTVKNYVSLIFDRLDLPSRTRTISHVMRLSSRGTGDGDQQ